MTQREEQMKASKAGAGPVHKIRCGRIDTSVWENTDADGKVSLNATLRKSWTQDGKKWDEAKMSLFRNELPDAILALQETYKWIRMDYKREGKTDE